MWSFDITVYEMQCVRFILLPACYFKYEQTWNLLKYKQEIQHKIDQEASFCAHATIYASKNELVKTT